MRKILEIGPDYAVLGEEEIACEAFFEAIERNCKRAQEVRDRQMELTKKQMELAKKREAMLHRAEQDHKKNQKRLDMAAYAMFAGVMLFMMSLGVAFGLTVGGL